MVYKETINTKWSSKIVKKVDVSGYTKGVYAVSIENKGIIGIKKLVVN